MKPLVEPHRSVYPQQLAPVGPGQGVAGAQRHDPPSLTVRRIETEGSLAGVMRQEETASFTPAELIQPVRPRHDSAQSRAHPETPNTPPVAAAVRDAEPAKPYWYAPYMALRQDWNTFIKGARQAGILSFYAKGYADMIPRIRALAENPDVPAVTRTPMMQVLENHQRYLSTRKHIEDYLDQVDRHIEEHDSMESLAEELDMKVAEISDYPDWRRENDRLTTAGEAILSDMETHGPHLDNILIGKARMNWALLNMSRAIRRDDEAISKEAIAAEELLAQPETRAPAMQP